MTNDRVLPQLPNKRRDTTTITQRPFPFHSFTTHHSTFTSPRNTKLSHSTSWRHVGEWRYSSTCPQPRHLMTSMNSFMARSLYSPETAWVPTEYKAGCAPGSISTLWRKEISFLCWKSNHESSVLQPVAQALYWLSYPGKNTIWNL